MLAISLLAASVPVFAANTVGHASGGWSEAEGYYINNSSNNFLSVSRAADKPDSHTGERITINIGSSASPVWYASAQGKTTWKNQDHYTTAQMEKSDGTVLTTSGRQSNNSQWKSEATSPSVVVSEFSSQKARTYWGKR